TPVLRPASGIENPELQSPSRAGNKLIFLSRPLTREGGHTADFFASVRVRSVPQNLWIAATASARSMLSGNRSWDETDSAVQRRGFIIGSPPSQPASVDVFVTNPVLSNRKSG